MMTSKNLLKKQCNTCKEIKSEVEFNKNKKRKDGLRFECQVCQKARNAKHYKNNREKELLRAKERVKTKRGHLSGYLADAKRRAKEKGLLFNITLDYLESITTDTCPVFKTPFNWGRDGKNVKSAKPDSPSLDRIIPSLGYVIGNVVFICHRANSIKQDATEKELYTVADWLHDARKEVLNNALSQ